MFDDILRKLDAITGAQNAPKTRTKPATRRNGARGTIDHVITKNTPRHNVYVACPVCIPAPQFLNITGSNGSWDVPWLSRVGVKVLNVDWGGIGMYGQFHPSHAVTDMWNPDIPAHKRPLMLEQWVRIEVRADNGVPKWAEFLTVEYARKYKKRLRYITPKGGMLDRRNLRYAENANGIPVPVCHMQPGCSPPDDAESGCATSE